jgi:hypothetical protein
MSSLRKASLLLAIALPGHLSMHNPAPPTHPHPANPLYKRPYPCILVRGAPDPPHQRLHPANPLYKRPYPCILVRDAPTWSPQRPMPRVLRGACPSIGLGVVEGRSRGWWGQSSGLLIGGQVFT